MKLTAERSEELKKLSNCFEKIEALAAKMGVEVDDLIQEYKNNNTAAYAHFKKSIFGIANRRQELLKKVNPEISERQLLNNMSISQKDKE
jgi:hypothetical protein